MSSPERDNTESGPLLTPWATGLAVGRYALMGKIAAGGMAEIWLARQAGPRGFEKVVVIKKILDSFCHDQGFVEMFLDEARTAAQLNHPNVVQIYDLGEHEQAYFIAMEYLPGETVARVARVAMRQSTPLPYTFAARIIADAAAGLGYAHAKKGLDGQPLNIVHRDVSPQNLIVTYEGRLKVLDFGVARAANRATLTEEGKLKGKVPYMSPEQARTLPIDRRADIFSLGIILYELIGRCRLFQFEDFLVGLKAVAGTDPIPSPVTRNPEVPEGLAAVALKALAREPDDRYQTAEQLREGLEDWLRTQPNNPGSPELSAFMHQLFAERIEKTARLIESARAGLLGSVDSTIGKAGTTPPSEASMPGGLGSRPKSRPGRARWVYGAVGLAAGLLMIGGFALRPTAPIAQPEVLPTPPPPASLSIETDPPGAAVWVDGVEVGNAPVSIASIKPGIHTIRASASGHEPGARAVEIQRNAERTNLVLTLKPLAPLQPTPDAGVAKIPVKVLKGKLSLTTAPWSQVFEGSRKLGDTPLVELPLPVGKHTLRLRSDERNLEKTISVEIKSGDTTVVREKL